MTPMIPRSEYPRPQFVRDSYLCLNGEWEFEPDISGSGKSRKLYEAEKLSGKILVPFCPESSLSGVHQTDFLNCVWYRRTVSLPENWNTGRTLLHFDAVDWKSTVYLNGKEALTHIGGSTPFTVDVTDYVENGCVTVTLCAEDDVRGPAIPGGKQSEQYHSHGCFYTRVTGIWQTVWMENVPDTYIDYVKYYPDVMNGTILIEAKVIGKGELQATAYYEGRNMGSAARRSRGGLIQMEIPLKETHLWEPGCGRLYDITLGYNEDRVKSYFGMRNISLEGMRFCINGRSVFQRLVLDQGYYADGIWTAPSDEALIGDIEKSLAMGFNGARLHQKVFEPRFLYHCDRMGYMVWGEFGNWGLDHSLPGAVHHFLPSWCEEIERDFNHPAIIGWCPFNETWDVNGRRQYDGNLKLVYETTKRLDPTRPCIDTSGNYHVITDIFDVHDYEQNPSLFKERFDRLMTNGTFLQTLELREMNNPTSVLFTARSGGLQAATGFTIFKDMPGTSGSYVTILKNYIWSTSQGDSNAYRAITTGRFVYQ